MAWWMIMTVMHGSGWDLIFPESSTGEEQKKIRSQSRYFLVRE
ncbi:16383_t:CDS:2, partial [Entrophospora sp. SA101]